MKIFSAAAVAVFAATSASALSVGITDGVHLDTAALGWTSVTSQNFETYSEGNTLEGVVTNVGTFSPVGGTGSGGTVDGTCPGNKLCVRDGNVYGRDNTDPLGGGMFLDSNDTFGIVWRVSLGGTLFDRLLFTLTDGSDVGAYVRVTGTDGSSASSGYSGASDGNDKTVSVFFDGLISSALITVENFKSASSGDYKINDGLSIDGIRVGSSVLSQTPGVPLPVSSLLLLGGFGALAARARSRKI